MNYYNISVIIPTYNREKTIKRCIYSVINQTYDAYEIIVVDDGSLDRTIDEINSIKDSRIKILKQNHEGAQTARNNGVLNANGNYIAFLDSDDEWIPTKLERQVNVLKEKDDVILWCNCYRINDITKNENLWIFPPLDGQESGYRELLRHPGPMFQGMLLKKKWIMEMGMLDDNVPAFQEWETSIRLAKTHNFYHMSAPLFIYHIHDDTMSKNLYKGLKGIIYIYSKHKNEIIQEFGKKRLKKMFKAFLINYLKGGKEE